MARVDFPRESSQVAAIQAAMSTASLGDLRIAMEELTVLSHKTGGVAQSIFSGGLFEAAMERAEELNDREIVLNHQICLMRQEMGDLAIGKDRFTPEQIAEQMDALQQKIFSCKAPSTPYLANQLRELERQWLHIHFLFDFPVAEELNPDSFQSNLLSRLTHRMDGLKTVDPKKAALLQQMLSHWQTQCQWAEEIYCNQKNGASLPEDVRLEVEQRFFERMLGCKIEQLDRRELVAALMDSLSDQMMSAEI